MAERPTKPFTLAGPKAPPVRDKDNAAHTHPPPKGVHLDHPRLAPRGMAGIKPSPTIARTAPAKPVRLPGPRPNNDVAKEFKSLVRQPQGHDRSHDR